jgi:fumarate hydratase class II
MPFWSPSPSFTAAWPVDMKTLPMDNDLTLKEAALKLGFVTEELFDRVVDPAKMVRPYVAGGE